MHQVVIDEPYEFVPPYEGTLWPRFLQQFIRRRMRIDFGIETLHYEGVERIRASIAAGHAVILAPNHCRPSDPMVVNELCRLAGLQPQTMASWHVFKQGWLKRFVFRRVGGFSVYREGTDRQALNAAIGILCEGTRPLVIFPEGVITRSNDRLLAMMEGLSFIARSAAKKRAKENPEAKVVVHPVAIRYRFDESQEKLEASLNAALDDIEHRLSWRPKQDPNLKQRIYRVGGALLWLKEIEYFGAPQTGVIKERLQGLINRMLEPIEKEWVPDVEVGDKTIVARVKQLRTAILPDMIEDGISDDERSRRWNQLADLYLAQQLGHYPPNYIRNDPTPERMLETVEKFEEDLTDKCRVHGKMSVTVKIGEAIDVSPKRVRGQDPVMTQLEAGMHEMLGLPHEKPVSESSAESLTESSDE